MICVEEHGKPHFSELSRPARHEDLVSEGAFECPLTCGNEYHRRGIRQMKAHRSAACRCSPRQSAAVPRRRWTKNWLAEFFRFC